MTPASHRNGFDMSFRKNAIKLYKDNHQKMRETAKILGISCGTLSKWIKKYEACDIHDSSTENPDIHRLEQEIREIKNNLDLLKSIVLKALIEKTERN